ncbi:MAG: 23S rRNA (adenine(2503)-C(2))-methyltransferase RlmN [Spirochaetia bacterium]|nr:23S rRNA (adenine(2503)-C(2))-methyltransferase RlmN [Spirochaetia bacterium]
MADKPHLLDLNLQEWSEYIIGIGHKKYRARQIFEWLHTHLELDVTRFSNIPDDIKNHILNDFYTTPAKVVKHLKSTDGTEKILFEMKDQKFVETVWLKLRNRNTVCVSSQAGCSLYCEFCMTAKGKFQGNLSTGEILEQVYIFKRLVGETVNNVVIMGMGEPLMNYDAVMKACNLLNHDFGLNIGLRRITVSTAGVLPGIKKFINNEEPYNLAISVHSLNHDVRLKIMDAEKKWPISDLVKYLIENKHNLKKNKLTIEYLMIGGLNMTSRDAKELGYLAQKLDAKINLIPLNFEFDDYKRPDEKSIDAFFQAVKHCGVQVFNRSSPGYDIQAACGMLKYQTV